MIITRKITFIQRWLITTTLILIACHFAGAQIFIVNHEQFNTNPVPTTPGSWAGGSWNLNFNYATNCHDATSEPNTARIAASTYNSYFWIPVTFVNGNTYQVNLWRKNGRNMTVVFNTSMSTTSPLATETILNGTATWQSITFSGYTHSAATVSGYIGICNATGNGSTMYVDDITITETIPACSYPVSQASAPTISVTGETTVSLSWTRGSGNQCLVVARPASSPLVNPVDGMNYTANAVFGSGSQTGAGNYVLYKGTGTSVNITNLEPGIVYHFYIYEFNNTGPCYLVAGSTSNTTMPAATNYYINDNILVSDVFTTAAGNSSNSGKLPSRPKASLTNLLATYTLNSGDTIFIDAGVYHNEERLNFSVSGVTFLGAGTDLTIIDDELAGMSTNYFMYITGSDVTLKNMTIKGYENNGTQTPGHSGQALTLGGGASGILIDNVIMSTNGGSGGNPSISVLANTSVTISGGGGVCNTWHTAYTGGIEAFGNGITLNIENYAMAYNFKTGSYDGGGVLINGNSTTQVNISNTRFFNNEASDGGGISQRGGVLTVTDCVFENNLAGQTSSTVYGGGVRISGGTATFTNCTFIGNQTGSAGGTLRGGGIGVYSLDGPVNLTLTHCLFSGNLAVEGTDLYADMYSSNTVTVTATNTTFSAAASNTIYNRDANISLTNCGNPAVSGSNSPAVVKVNTSNPTSVPNPSPQVIVSGDCSSTIVLPVELTFLNSTCIDGTRIIHWQTASETNNDFFIVEGSKDGIHYEPQGLVEGSGTSGSSHDYSFVADAQSGFSYYRLIQVDFNGTETSSEAIVVESGCDTEGFRVHSSNVGQGKIQLEILSSEDQEINVTVVDITGRLIDSSMLQIEAGISYETLEIKGSAGIYILNITGKGIEENIRVIN